MKRRFSTNGKVYEIPDDKVDAFMSANPKAVEVKFYDLDGKQYNIPLDKVDTFETAKGLKKKVGGEDSGTSTSQPSVLSSSGTTTFDASKIPQYVTPQQKELVQYGANVQKAKEEHPDKVAEEAAINSTMDYYNNNPSLLAGRNFNLQRKGSKSTDKFSLNQLKNLSPFQQNVAELKNKILNGELITATSNDGKVIAARDAGDLKNFVSGVKDAWHGIAEANEYADLSVDDKVKKALEIKPDGYLPEKVNQSSGLYQTGGAIPSLAKYGAGLATGAVMEAAIPETAGTSLGLSPFVGWLMSVPDMAKQGRMNAEMEAIKKLKFEHPDWNNERLYGEAQKAGVVGFTEGMATGTAMNLLSASLPKDAGQGLWKATGQFLRNQPQSIAEISLLSGGTTYAGEKAKQALGIPITDAEAWDKAGHAINSGAMMQLAFNVAHGVIALPKYGKAQAYQMLTNVSPEKLQELQQKAVEAGFISPEQVEQANKGLADFKEAQKKIIPTGDQEKDAVITGLVQKKANLEKAKAEADKSFHPQFDAQIEAADKRIQIAQQSADPIKYAEQDDLDGTRNFNPKPFDDLSKKEVEGIATEIPKEYGDAEVEEVGGGEGAERKYKANPTVNRQQGFIKIKDKIPTEDKVYNDKEDAVKASESALAQHYYENGMDETLKPESKSTTTPKVEESVNQKVIGDKKADIEKRRNDELNKVGTKKTDLSKDEQIEGMKNLLKEGNKFKLDGQNVRVEKYNDGIKVVDEQGNLVKGLLLTKYNLENPETLDKLSYILHQNNLGEKVIKDESAIKEINAKYDAELKSLENEKAIQAKEPNKQGVEGSDQSNEPSKVGENQKGITEPVKTEEITNLEKERDKKIKQNLIKETNIQSEYLSEEQIAGAKDKKGNDISDTVTRIHQGIIKDYETLRELIRCL